MPRYAFLMEQTLGHVVHANTLQRLSSTPEFADIQCRWLPVPFSAPDGYDQLPGARSNWTLRGSLRARSLLTAELVTNPAPDALFIHTQTISQLCKPWMRRIPTVISLDATPENIDEMGSEYGQMPTSGIAERVKKLVLRRTLTSAKYLVCWSQWAANSLIASYGIDPGRIRVIPPGVDTSLFVATNRTGRTGPVQLLFVGGDFKRKGGVELLQAFANLRGSGLDCELNLVCPTPPSEASLPGVHIHTNAMPGSEAMLALYRAADIFVLPSLGDCLPLAILEAMACGLPIVATCVGAINEAAVPGKNGTLVNPRDASALERAIGTYIAEPALRLEHGASSRLAAVQHFDSLRSFRAILASLQEAHNA